MGKRTCDWCNDPATTSITVDSIKGRLCDNCSLEAESEFLTATITKD